MGEVVWHTYQSAAKRVGRSSRVIRLWRSQGMAMGWRTIEGQRARVVREDVLLKTFREKLQADPVHQARMRRVRRAAGLPEPAPRPKVTPEPTRGAVHAPDEPTALPTDIDAPPVNPLADMKPIRAEVEWSTMRESMKTEPAPCIGIDAFTADRVDPEEQPVLEMICAACPMIELCRAFADVERPPVGFWAGRPAVAYA